MSLAMASPFGGPPGMMTLEVSNKEHFQELQQRMMDNNRLMQSVNAKVSLYERERRRGQLTLKEIEDLPETVQTYKPIGKMFLLVPKKELVTETKQTISKYEADLNQLANQQKYLQNQIKETEKGIKELIIKRIS